jgi:membrane-associated phospholipid phosphatase
MSDDNAASGHAFIAAVPWLNLARRLPGTWPRWAARCGSVLTGWSRLNDRKHYLSQVILGWTIAWNAVDAVHGEKIPAAAPDNAKGSS